jgi:hypothetical protein
MTEILKHYHESWRSGENITIQFDDKTAQPRSVKQIDDFFEALRDAAGKHGFDIYTWGNDRKMLDWLRKF